MATLLLQAAGGLVGGLFGPAGAALGAAAGSLAGYTIDSALLTPTRHVEGARLSGARPLTAEEGTPIARVYGYARVSGTVIWATRLQETSRTERHGGKGGGGGTEVTTYSYHGNVAIGLCEGPVAAVKRIWADGKELDLEDIEFRFYTGADDQMPDPLIEAKQGEGMAPAYRGLAYIVFERLALERFGNRIPQFQVEVIRPVGRLEEQVRAVCVIPGSTEQGYAPTEVISRPFFGVTRQANRHVLHGPSDWAASIDELQAVCPNLEHVSLVVAWFGDDLRAGECTIRPGLVTRETDNESLPWSVAGMGRGHAGVRVVSESGGRPAYGGSPSDASVIAAIADLKARGLKVTLCPFLLMDVAEGNALPDPWSDGTQGSYPWRGRITCDPAIGRAGTADQTSVAANQVEDFVEGAEGYRRFVNHCASLAVAAGGVDAFIIGSEMRGLTQVRDETGAFPFVGKLRSIAADVRTALGPGCKLTYGADWSEYFGYHPADGTGDVFFHLDPLWADANIDAVGIDNYMPLSDWRDADETEPGGNPDGALQASDRAAFMQAIAGGEGYDWYYASDADRRARMRSPITDGLAGKPWVFRYKDLAGWWSNAHFERVGGAESATATDWVPGGKPVWFTEIGCPAIDKGATQPNVFVDAKSAESSVPWFSNGGRDDREQRAFLEAHSDYWSSGTEANPVSAVTGAPMVDTSRLYLWAWDARPFPAFPVNTALWGDGENWLRGHWLNGRLGSAPLAETAEAVMAYHGVTEDVAVSLTDIAQGVILPAPASVREVLEPLASAYGHAMTDAGTGHALRAENAEAARVIDSGDIVDIEGEALVEEQRLQASELPREVLVHYRDGLRDYQAGSSYSRRVDGGDLRQEAIDLPCVLDASLGDAIADRMLARAWSRNRVLRFSLPMRFADIAPGEVLAFAGESTRWLVTRTDAAELIRVEAVPLAPPPSAARVPGLPSPRATGWQSDVGVPAFELLDLPMQAGSEPHEQFRLAAWSSPVRRQAVYVSPGESGFDYRTSVVSNAVIGTLTAPLAGGFSGRFDQVNAVELSVPEGSFTSVSMEALLAGGNLLAVKAANGAWEVLQFMTAEEVAAGQWRLSVLLRGQGGTEDAMLAGADTGARAVLLNDAVLPVGIKASEAGLAVNLRIGVAGKPFTDRWFETVEATGGLRSQMPLSPVHLKAVADGSGGVDFTWIRRTRIDGDSWLGRDVPLGEESELYAVRVHDGSGAVVREDEVTAPALHLNQSELAAIGLDAASAFDVEVAQVSQAVGEGVPVRRTIQLL